MVSSSLPLQEPYHPEDPNKTVEEVPPSLCKKETSQKDSSRKQSKVKPIKKLNIKLKARGGSVPVDAEKTEKPKEQEEAKKETKMPLNPVMEGEKRHSPTNRTKCFQGTAEGEDATAEGSKGTKVAGGEESIAGEDSNKKGNE